MQSGSAQHLDEVGTVLKTVLDVIEKWGLDVRLAQSGIPFLQGLGALNRWWVERRARQRVPDLVAGELARVYGLDASETERAGVEAALARAGVEDPDRAYELALRRLTARIAQPDLADYLGEAFAEVGAELRRLVTLTTSKRYLRRVEDVLALFPVTPEEQEPRWFRETGPIAVDFRDGSVFRREDVLERLRESCAARVVTVLQAEGASGKTVVVRQFAFERHVAGDFDEVYLLELGAHGALDPAAVVAELADVRGLIIVDDAHLQPRVAAALFEHALRAKDLHALIVTRPSLWDSLDPRHEKLADGAAALAAIVLDPTPAVTGVADRYAAGRGLDAGRADHIAQQVLESGRDLWFLARALEAAGSGGEADAAAAVVREARARLERLERRMEGADPRFPEICVAIAAVYMSEVPAGEAFLTRTLPFSVATLNELCRRGEIGRIERGDDVYYVLGHSAIAREYWEAGARYRRRLGFRNHLDALARYVTSEVDNVLTLLLRVPAESWSVLLERLAAASQLPAVFEREPSLDAIRACAERGLLDQAASALDEQAVETLQDVLVARLDGADAAEAAALTYALAETESGAVALERIDAPALAAKLGALTDSDVLEKALSYLVDAGEHGEAVLAELDPERIGRALSSCTDPDQLATVVDALADHLGYGWAADHLDARVLAGTLLEPATDLTIVTSFLRWAFDLDDALGEALMEALNADYRAVCDKLLDAAWIADAVAFIDLMGGHGDYDWEWLELLDRGCLRELMESEDVEDGCQLFEALGNAGMNRDAALAFVRTLRNPELRERCRQLVDALT